MNQKRTIIALLVCLLIATATAQLSRKDGHCPLQGSISKCIPSCTSDFQCSSGKKCCPNKCGTRSCATASSVNTGNNSYKDTAVYCAGVKCQPYEKCVFDRNTKREKCTRT